MYTSGPAETQSAYRSELMGIDSLLTALEMIVKQYGTNKGAIEIALDNRLAMNQSADSEFLCPSQSCFDILQDIRERICISPIDITWRWVE